MNFPNFIPFYRSSEYDEYEDEYEYDEYGTNNDNNNMFIPKGTIDSICENEEQEKRQFKLKLIQKARENQRDRDNKIRYPGIYENQKIDTKKNCPHCGIDYEENGWARGRKFVEKKCCKCEKTYKTNCTGCSGTCVKGCKREFCVDCFESYSLCCEVCSCKGRAAGLTCMFCMDCSFICEMCKYVNCKSHGDYGSCKKGCDKILCYNCREDPDPDFEEDEKCCGMNTTVCNENDLKEYEIRKKEIDVFNNTNSLSNKLGMMNFMKDVKKEQKQIDSSKIEQKKQICGNCGKIASKKCSRCKKQYYCSQECHVSHWKIHKKTCKKEENI